MNFNSISMDEIFKRVFHDFIVTEASCTNHENSAYSILLFAEYSLLNMLNLFTWFQYICTTDRLSLSRMPRFASAVFEAVVMVMLCSFWLPSSVRETLFMASLIKLCQYCNTRPHGGLKTFFGLLKILVLITVLFYHSWKQPSWLAPCANTFDKLPTVVVSFICPSIFCRLPVGSSLSRITSSRSSRILKALSGHLGGRGLC